MNFITITPVVLSAISIFGMLYLGYLQWRATSRRAKSGEALDWSTAANNLRKEIDAQSAEIVNLHLEIKTIKDNYKSLQELSKRFMKELAKRGEPIILTEGERALLYDTNPKASGAK